MSISTRTFGEHEGRRVDAFTLQSDTGVAVDIIGYGVAVRDWRVPVAGGAPRPVVLGFEGFADYPAHSPHFGAIAGRVANRFSGGSFELDGKTYRLDTNESGNTLHGGPQGLGRQVWQGEPDSARNAVRFTFTSPDGALTLRLWSDRPAVQLYNGLWTDIPVPGLGGRRYGKHSGLCLEDQMYPDALHQPHFPSIICSPDAPYSHWCEIEIG
jgi:galactose mutarotase-like enzyme